MTKDDALKLVKEVGPLPKNPVVQRAEKSHCPCGGGVLLVCAEGVEFDPAYYVCVKCSRTVRIGELPRTVHVLEAGRPFCGMPGVPRDWPKNHWWVRREEVQHANCPECLKEAK